MVDLAVWVFGASRVFLLTLDTYFNEILGYNLAIEMFGLGELRLHEIQKLRHYGFDARRAVGIVG